MVSADIVGLLSAARRGDRRNATLALLVVQLHDLPMGPVEVESQVRYLLVQPVRGVARHSPRPAVSTSNSPSQWGQRTCSRLWPFWLTRW